MKNIRFAKSGFLAGVRAFALVGMLAAAIPASAQLRSFTGYDSQSLARNDDGSTGLVDIGFTTNFFGTSGSQLYVNNNGNVTFGGSLGTFTPFGLAGTSAAIIAPFFGDVDTRGGDSNLVTFGAGVLGGHNAFAVNWLNVGVYSTLPIYNTFQLVMVDRSDIAVGDFDFEFNFTDMNWETGTASGGNNLGLGGNSARIGYSSGGETPTSFELLGSGINGYFLDSNLITGLIYNSLGVAFDGEVLDGRYAFSVRNGVVEEPPVNGAVPEPSTYGLMGAAGLIGLIVMRRRLAKRAA